MQRLSHWCFFLLALVVFAASASITRAQTVAQQGGTQSIDASVQAANIATQAQALSPAQSRKEQGLGGIAGIPTNTKRQKTKSPD